MMRISSITKNSYANGPGRRNVLHVQGCGIGCAGCFNKHTWAVDKGEFANISDLAVKLLEGYPDGVTISGGEPMEQWPEVLMLIRRLLTIRPALSIVIFTGWTRKRLENTGYLEVMRTPWYLNNSHVSLVVAGPYVSKLACSDQPLISSTNQEIIFTNPALSQEDLTNLPRVEVSCGEDGMVQITGLPDKETLEALTGGPNVSISDV
jgi:anaerobic ribonucleoside-triphosphate reductase activating protein